MKNIFKLLVATSFLLIGCIDNKEISSERINIDATNKIKIIEIDSCEYLLFEGFKKGGITHKQNCKFCLERNKK